MVTGMHRSGTSLVARLFHEAGADLGDPNGFIAPDRWNPDGYFEQTDVVDLNRRLIHGCFGKFAYFAPPSETTILRRAGRISGEIESIASKRRNHIVKDCRFCLTLPAWRKHGADLKAALVCIRDPWEVARSLRRRNKITMLLGYKLWFLHYTRLMGAIRGLPSHFALYGNFLNLDLAEDEVRRTCAFCNVQVDQTTIDRFIRSVKPRRDAEDEKSRRKLPEDVARMWDNLVARREFASSLGEDAAAGD